MAVVAAEKMGAGRLPDAQRGLGCQRLEVGGPAEAVGAEDLACQSGPLNPQRPRRYLTPCMSFLSHGEMASRITPAAMVISPPTMKVWL